MTKTDRLLAVLAQRPLTRAECNRICCNRLPRLIAAGRVEHVVDLSGTAFYAAVQQEEPKR